MLAIYGHKLTMHMHDTTAQVHNVRGNDTKQIMQMGFWSLNTKPNRPEKEDDPQIWRTKFTIVFIVKSLEEGILSISRD